MPLTSSGKIDRKALPLPEDLPGTAPQSYVAPGTPTQATLAEIWSEPSVTARDSRRLL